MRAGFLLRRRNQCGVALAVPQWRQKFASERCGFPQCVQCSVCRTPQNSQQV
jgi:hypothetical protein